MAHLKKNTLWLQLLAIQIQEHWKCLKEILSSKLVRLNIKSTCFLAQSCARVGSVPESLSILNLANRFC